MAYAADEVPCYRVFIVIMDNKPFVIDGIVASAPIRFRLKKRDELVFFILKHGKSPFIEFRDRFRQTMLTRGAIGSASLLVVVNSI